VRDHTTLRVPFDLEAVETRAETAGPVRNPPRPPAVSAADNQDDLSDWILATAPKAVAYASSLLGNREQAEDVVQDCYCRLPAKTKRFNLRRDGEKLLLKSISNACINVRLRERPVVSPFATEGRPREVEDQRARDPGRNLLDLEFLDAIGRSLASLPVQQRAALELKSQGHSLLEIAEILQVSESNAGVLIHRARTAMAEQLALYRGDDSR
jgi:RNA polymerase sigma-70 factor, ECF subfamily